MWFRSKTSWSQIRRKEYCEFWILLIEKTCIKGSLLSKNQYPVPNAVPYLGKYYCKRRTDKQCMNGKINSFETI